ncbi:ATPase [Metallosphaera cuprina]|uniref:P-loop ATPase/GTPase-like protein n=1 Tax=Metallosphaera cuprina (strain Ar-4) TaxID=1006006 RepID=F4FYU9_METCR|nr:ATPase [Metallosphaera cuprina]AEB94338.1 P-loop ATPase/GTPase-like protein [Metallosphaera cuprina Ar-4]
MKILINGGLAYDSGKTRLGLTLISELRSVGIDLLPLKPVAGHNIWYSFSTVQKSLEKGVLLGNDALAYHELTGMDPEKVNPFAVLLSPVNLEAIGKNTSLYNYLMEKGYPIILRIRKDNCSEYIIEEHQLVPESLKPALNAMKERFKPKINSIESINEIIANSGYLVKEHVKRFLESNSNVIVESYNNAAFPTFIEDLDFVITVFPSLAYVFDGVDYMRFIRFMSKAPWLIKAELALRYIRSVHFALEPITSKNNELVNYLIRKS